MRYRIVLILTFVYFTIFPSPIFASTCTYEATITNNHLDFSITSDTDKLAVIQYIRRNGSAIITNVYSPDIGTPWNYYSDPQCVNENGKGTIACKQNSGTGEYWSYEIPSGTYHLLPNGIYGLDFNISPTYESLRIMYGVLPGTTAEGATWTDCARTGIVSTPTATATATATMTATATATSTPTVTATPTITATPTQTPMGVPNIKQYEGGWENQVYDHTIKTIKDWGCALTSAVMVLKYHGHNTMPDTLNNWLNSQSDGYIRNGLINWLAVSRFTKINDSNSSPTLEYKRLGVDDDKLDSELSSLHPVILKEPGHFIVATGKKYDTYFINDPGYATRNTLESYGDNYLAINSYTPTHSDLSYMMFVVDFNYNLELLDSNGNIIETIKYIEESIKNEGGSLLVLTFEKPADGIYKLKLTGPTGDYVLDSYLYDENGNVTQNSFPGILFANDLDTYNINYNSQNKVAVTIDEIIKDLDNAYSDKLIKNRGIYQTIKVHLQIYKRYPNKIIIRSLINQIRMYTPRFIDQTYSLILQQNLLSLID
ncbi:hypothetical protein A2130_04015 [Candidatus Woesebacteria bacterium GWC2_33_12]|uniref:Glycoside hydrolase family 48 n=1 Tax=Candidatus Woesebacteria bacterium GW2011_GWB1_33_22 TaxID=1618566 RepID=A0A0G0C2Y3_9BACT|nr:MAG: Glycoside hydrolase family 48 [Candidatus Woesebacteria bacterium GW2011_GWC2_33_12]KKP42665.1 MAG: Glycoside hydrolase family 48 [Candidatus Woesebacteria bacterium GW2011_GWA2_33_20]KKP45560.1 MAG: Glycoside hydrolase family 48 [Candidatus Woesebacteria bacterium GW2011_GWB1_33_22]KKP47432.1 MAG: Glycoside hydrolase family 48 [Microgenomates group bacterium GW2011_GWC1_33_28]KKP51178.1 MAG: Glycoside hydrolase family 48 [Candidatus Woesebacteria bacterium GW2011_GWA1_33_33]OGM06966.1